MQIQCHNCRNPLMVNHYGGHFQCPICGAVNAIGMPVGVPIQPLPTVALRPSPANDRRRALVVGAFVGLGIVAMLLGWLGVVVGVALLAWAIAGSIGKVKGPINLVYPHSLKKTALSVVGIGLGCVVTMCGVMGGVAQQERAERDAREVKERDQREASEKAERERQEAEDSAAKAAKEAELRASVGKAAAEYGAGLDAVEKLIAEDKSLEAEGRLKDVAAPIAEYRSLDPVPPEIAALMLRHDALTPTLEAKRRAREAAAWIQRAELVVSDKSRCEDESEVEAARKQVVGLQASDPAYARIQELNARLNECRESMPPPSEWRYDVRSDPMGGTVANAVVDSAGTLSFDFPYQGEQHATLKLRREKGLSVLISIERGQFMCTMGCAVMVRFDDGAVQRWRAVGPSDFDTEVIFLRNESKFLKALAKAHTVRIEVDFYQEGRHVLEFPVARFDASKLK